MTTSSPLPPRCGCCRRSAHGCHPGHRLPEQDRLEPECSFERSALPAQLREEASLHAGAIFAPGELGYADPSAAEWTFVPDYPISKLHFAGWAEWFAEELGDFEEDGEPERAGDYCAMQYEPIQDAIIVLERDGIGYIWDGFHRTGACATSGRSTVPAIVGRVK